MQTWLKLSASIKEQCEKNACALRVTHCQSKTGKILWTEEPEEAKQ